VEIFFNMLFNLLKAVSIWYMCISTTDL